MINANPQRRNLKSEYINNKKKSRENGTRRLPDASFNSSEEKIG